MTDYVRLPVMREFSMLLAVIVMVGASVLPSVYAQNPDDEMDNFAIFRGSVFINGALAPPGTLVTAQIGGQTRTVYTTKTVGFYGSDGDIETTPFMIEGTSDDDGASIIFLINGVTATHLPATWTPFGDTDLDLAATIPVSPPDTGGDNTGGGGGGGGGGFTPPVQSGEPPGEEEQGETPESGEEPEEDTTAPTITGVTVDPALPLTNDGTAQALAISLVSDEFPLTVTVTLRDENGDAADAASVTVASAADLPLTYTIPAGLSAGTYTLAMTASDAAGNADTLILGTIEVVALQAAGGGLLTGLIIALTDLNPVHALYGAFIAIIVILVLLFYLTSRPARPGRAVQPAPAPPQSPTPATPAPSDREEIKRRAAK